VWHVLGSVGQTVDAWTRVAAVGVCDVARQPIPVADLLARERRRSSHASLPSSTALTAFTYAF
jgi:hypothetical protein